MVVFVQAEINAHSCLFNPFFTLWPVTLLLKNMQLLNRVQSSSTLVPTHVSFILFLKPPSPQTLALWPNHTSLLCVPRVSPVCFHLGIFDHFVLCTLEYHCLSSLQVSPWPGCQLLWMASEATSTGFSDLFPVVSWYFTVCNSSNMYLPYFTVREYPPRLSSSGFHSHQDFKVLKDQDHNLFMI